jgi:hypothetical protein
VFAITPGGVGGSAKGMSTERDRVAAGAPQQVSLKWFETHGFEKVPGAGLGAELAWGGELPHAVG